MEVRTVTSDDERFVSWGRLVVALGARTAMSSPGARVRAASSFFRSGNLPVLAADPFRGTALCS